MKDGVATLLLLAASVAAAPAAAAAEPDRVHVVRPGETLWQIAAHLTGDPHRWPELYRANRDQIKDPSTLYPGQRLAIPDFEGPSAGSAPVTNARKGAEPDAEPSGTP